VAVQPGALCWAGRPSWRAAGPKRVVAVGLLLAPIPRTAALAVVAALDAAVAAEVIVAGRRDRVAGWLLTPYLAWSLFATALTATVEDPTGARAASDPSGG